MFCKNCGNEIKDGVKFCSKCGNQIGGGEPAKSTPISKDVYAAKNKFSFKIFAKGRSTILKTIKQFKGAYTADFIVEDNRLLITEMDNYGETVYSIPYYLIKKFEIKEKISALFLFTYILCGLCGLFLLVTGDEALIGVLVLALICAFIYFFGFKKITFYLLLNDDKKVKIRLMNISKKKSKEKSDFINLVDEKIKKAVNNGDAFKTASTTLTIGDIRNKANLEEKKQLVESIKNNISEK